MMKKYIIKTSEGYVKFIKRSKVVCTQNINEAHIYQSPYKVTVTMANNKELFKQLAPEIKGIILNIVSRFDIEQSSTLDQYHL